ncbi:MAG: ATP-binding protein [Kibdelosporangium sp.]
MRPYDDRGEPVPALLWMWARRLPAVAADLVEKADMTRQYLYLTVGAARPELAWIRTRVASWARALGLRAEQREDIVLAVDEATANAVEHAYPAGSGTVTIFASGDRDGHMVNVIVSDEGTWRPRDYEPTAQGRGMRMMRKLADVFNRFHDDRGTTVVLRFATAVLV